MDEKCPLITTFKTEQDLRVHREYFKNFKEIVNNLLRVCKVDDEDDSQVNPRLLTYTGEFIPLKYSFESSSKDFRDMFNFNNRRVVLNKTLQTTIRPRSSLAKREYLISKYELYQFLPMPFETVATSPDFNELLFIIKVYRPFNPVWNTSIRIMQEIYMLGRNTLANLQHVIKCNIDYCGLKDVSEDICEGTVGSATEERKQLYPSYFFFINNTFYCDSRFHVPLSQEVRQWLSENKIETEEVTNLDCGIHDIPLQIGKPYLYQHQGQCEHVIMVSDVRCALSKDLVNFPRVTAVSNAMIRQCMLCGYSYARWLVMNCMKLTIARAYLCHRCLLSYCYIDGRKTGQFQVYQYVDPVLVLE